MDPALLSTARSTCYSAVVSDVCDALGMRNQSLATEEIRPVWGDGHVVMGWARTAVVIPVDRVRDQDNPYGQNIAYLDSLRADDVCVLRSDSEVGVLGELYATAALMRGAVGMLTDGVVRDRGMRPPDAMGRNDVDTMDTPIRMMGVEIKPGDFIVADADGIVVVPREMTAEVLELAINKAGTENKVRDHLRLGHTLGEAWVRYGVL